MGMSMRLGKSNAWKIVGSTSRDCWYDTNNDISLSYKLISTTNNDFSYDVIVTINQLNFLTDKRVDDGEIFICLTEQCRALLNTKHRYYPSIGDYGSNNTYHQYWWHNIHQHKGVGIQKVIRGKKDYVFKNITLYNDSLFYTSCYDNDYMNEVEVTRFKGFEPYYVLNAGIVRIKHREDSIGNIIENPRLSKLDTDTVLYNWNSSLSFRYNDANAIASNSFLNMASDVCTLVGR